MKKNQGIITVGKLWTRRKIVTVLLIFFFMLSSIIAVLTYYGQNVGCFTISLAEEVSNQSIYVSTDPTFSSYSPRLVCDSFSQAKAIPYSVIKTGYVRETNGVYADSGNSYIGYTYYIKNMGDESVTLQVDMGIASVTKNADEAVWVWYFSGEDDDKGRMFQKEDDLTNVPDNWTGYDQTYREREYFKDDYTVFTEKNYVLEPGEVKKTTLIIWLEGMDPDCDDNILGGQINFNIEYTLYNEADE